MADLAHEILVRFGTRLLAMRGQTVDSSIRDEVRRQLADEAMVYTALVQRVVPPEQPLCKNCGKRWGLHGGEWCTPGDFKGTRYEPA